MNSRKRGHGQEVHLFVVLGGLPKPDNIFDEQAMAVNRLHPYALDGQETVLDWLEPEFLFAPHRNWGRCLNVKYGHIYPGDRRFGYSQFVPYTGASRLLLDGTWGVRIGSFPIDIALPVSPVHFVSFASGPTRILIDVDKLMRNMYAEIKICLPGVIQELLQLIVLYGQPLYSVCPIDVHSTWNLMKFDEEPGRRTYCHFDPGRHPSPSPFRKSFFDFSVLAPYDKTKALARLRSDIINQ